MQPGLSLGVVLMDSLFAKLHGLLWISLASFKLWVSVIEICGHSAPAHNPVFVKELAAAKAKMDAMPGTHRVRTKKTRQFCTWVCQFVHFF